MGAGLGILFFGIIQGILIGVVLSLLLLIWHSSRTSIRELRVDRMSGVFHVASRHEGLDPVPGVIIARVDGPLFFADADRFRARLQELVGAEEDVRAVVIDATAIHLSDTDGADIIVQVAEELAARDIVLTFVGVHPPVLALWRRAGVFDAAEDDTVYETVGEAVEALERSAAGIVRSG
jgi:SulP family sulfate permease